MSATISAPVVPTSPTPVTLEEPPLPTKKIYKTRRKRSKPRNDWTTSVQQQDFTINTPGSRYANALPPTTSTSQEEDEDSCGPFERLSSDWSDTGRGSHIDFGADEVVPLVEGRFLGKGGLAWVHETTVKGEKLALKKMAIKRRMNTSEIKEIEVLKKLSHAHMIRLIGTYTHQRLLGILLHPVAVCDLNVFFEDAAAYRDGTEDDSQMSRLTDLGYFDAPFSDPHYNAWPIYSQIGCLVSAIAYLHSQSIRHKDLKPSNILLSRGRLYLSDFGNATDFSQLTQSATDNGGGTPRYLSPEAAELKPSGRASDIFSLGCVLLEILIFHDEGTLYRLGHNRPLANSAYYANLDKLDEWLPFSSNASPRIHNLVREVRAMLSHNPKRRPRAENILRRMTLCDKMVEGLTWSIFGDCCRQTYITAKQHAKELQGLQEQLLKVNHENRALSGRLDIANRDWQTLDQALKGQIDIAEKNKKAASETTSQLDEIREIVSEASVKYPDLAIPRNVSLARAVEHLTFDMRPRSEGTANKNSLTAETLFKLQDESEREKDEIARLNSEMLVLRQDLENRNRERDYLNKEMEFQKEKYDDRLVAFNIEIARLQSDVRDARDQRFPSQEAAPSQSDSIAHTVPSRALSDSRSPSHSSQEVSQSRLHWRRKAKGKRSTTEGTLQIGSRDSELTFSDVFMRQWPESKP